MKKVVLATREESTPSTPTKEVKQEKEEKKGDRKRVRKEKVKEETSWYEMSPVEEHGVLAEMKGRSKEQRVEDNVKLRTAIVANMMRRVTELAMGMRSRKEDDQDSEFIDRLELQMKTSMDLDEMSHFMEQERKMIGIKEWRLDEVRMKKEFRSWVVKLRSMVAEEQEEETIRELGRDRMYKAQEVEKEVKTEAEFEESSGEEKDWDREVQIDEDHTDGSDKEQCLWEKDHGQPDTDEDDMLSNLRENEVETKKMLVEICCSEKSRLTDQTRTKG